MSRGPPYKCRFSYCKEVFDSLKGLKIHLSKEHNFSTLTQQQVLRDWGYIDDGKKEFKLGGLKVVV